MKLHKICFVVAALLVACSTPAFPDVVSGTTNVFAGGSLHSTLTSSSTQTCTSIEVNPQGYLHKLIDASGAGQSATLTVYDEGASPTCAAADAIYTVVLLTGQAITLDIPLAHGLAYKLSAAAVSNIVITRD